MPGRAILLPDTEDREEVFERVATPPNRAV
jgi:hypothetical protein